MWAKQKGFTIVELLIVIVVIAVLAAVTIVAYNGIQSRAYMSKAVSIVDDVVKIVELYKVDNGVYPSTSGKYVCVGKLSDYPAENGFAAGGCSGFEEEKVDSTFNDALSKYASQIPNGSLPIVNGGSVDYRGIQYFSDGTYAEMYFVIRGKQACPKGTAYQYSTTNNTCVFVLSS